MCITKCSKWGELSVAPIQCFSVEDFSISPKVFVEENAPIFDSLPWDLYDVRRDQIQFLQQGLPFLKGAEYNHLWSQYFIGSVPFEEILIYYRMLTDEQMDAFNRIKPFRNRAISQFCLNAKDFTILRVPINSFTQTHALHDENFSVIDWRTMPRTFTEIDEQHVQLDSFTQVLRGIANKLLQFDPTIREFHFVAHHVRVTTQTNRIISNSPEGIHQDGYPFVVTALVVERENITGGESKIFDMDKTTPVFTSTLLPGHGILQPDLGTNLWHTVTPIHPISNGKAGFRSTIGLDINITK